MSVSFDGVRAQFAVIGTMSNKPFNCRIKCFHVETVYARRRKNEAAVLMPIPYRQFAEYLADNDKNSCLRFVKGRRYGEQHENTATVEPQGH